MGTRGVSNKLHEVIQNDASSNNISSKDHPRVIRRFSGGGAVLIDHNSILCGLILSKHDLKDTTRAHLFQKFTSGSSSDNIKNSGNGEMKFFPRLVMQWTDEVYRRAFQLAGVDKEVLNAFSIRENGKNKM